MRKGEKSERLRVWDPDYRIMERESETYDKYNPKRKKKGRQTHDPNPPPPPPPLTHTPHPPQPPKVSRQRREESVARACVRLFRVPRALPLVRAMDFIIVRAMDRIAPVSTMPMPIPIPFPIFMVMRLIVLMVMILPLRNPPHHQLFQPSQT